MSLEELQVKVLTFELQELLEQNILKDPKTVEVEMQRSKEMIQKLEGFGFIVKTDIELFLNTADPGSSSVKVTITLEKTSR